ncbi:hypothetical protein SEA_POLLUX_33 [Gordonia phage Pollux]|nr:hypothetical protein SEA_POLLUX_33 [Gordonia phage Pollux]
MDAHLGAVPYRQRMTGSSMAGKDISLATHTRLGGYIDQLQPMRPFVGYYLIFEIRDSWAVFHNWLDDNSSVASPARLILGTDEGATTPERQKIFDLFSKWQDDVPPDTGSSDEQNIVLAEKSLELLLAYIRHVAIQLRPETLTGDAPASFSRLRGRVNSLVTSQSLRKALAESEEAAEEARSATAETREELAKLSSEHLSKTYSGFARSEGAFAWGYNIAAVGLVAGTIYFAVTNPAPADSSLSQTIQHLATFAIVLGLAGFLAKQGSRHRTNATWSRVVSVQLTTLGSYVGGAESAEARDKMRLLVASRAFGSAPDTPASGDDFSWVQQIVSAIATNRSG